MNLKPREKLFEYGPKHLNNSELLAIILGHATKKENVFNLSKRILKEYGKSPLASLQNVSECQRLFNIGPVQASKLIACFEIGRRFFINSEDRKKILNAHDVFEYLKPMRQLPKEYICGLYLNTRHELIYDEVISIGTLESSTVHPRDVLYPAIEKHAYTFILAHNHPSGDPNPSKEDEYLTKQIKKAGDLMRIPLLDHLIIAKDSYFSFQEREIFLA